jgi:hypothetical protein
VLALCEKSAKELDLPWTFISLLQNYIRDLLANHLEDQKIQPFSSSEGKENLSLVCQATALGFATSPAAEDRSRRREGFGAGKVSPKRLEELFAALTQLHETQHAEVMVAVGKAQATAERSEAKVDVCTEMLEKTARSNEHEQGNLSAMMEQKIEALHAAQAQNQATMNQWFSRNVAAADEIQTRRLDTLSSDIAHVKGAIDKIKFDTKHDELRAKLQEVNTELLCVVREIPEKCSRSFDTCLRSSSTDIISGIVQQSDAAHSSMHKKLRELEDHVQVSVATSVEQLAGKLIKSTEAIMTTIQDYSTKSATQLASVRSAQSLANVALKNQLSNYHDGQFMHTSECSDSGMAPLLNEARKGPRRPGSSCSKDGTRSPKDGVIGV